VSVFLGQQYQRPTCLFGFDVDAGAAQCRTEFIARLFATNVQTSFMTGEAMTDVLDRGR
jgi:hypothetical protein